MIIILDISYELKHSFILCILKKIITSFLLVLTNRLLIAEKPSPDLSSCTLEGRKQDIHPASHRYNTDTHLGSCVYAQCESVLFG